MCPLQFSTPVGACCCGAVSGSVLQHAPFGLRRVRVEGLGLVAFHGVLFLFGQVLHQIQHFIMVCFCDAFWCSVDVVAGCDEKTCMKILSHKILCGLMRCCSGRCCRCAAVVSVVAFTQAVCLCLVCRATQLVLWAVVVLAAASCCMHACA